jgi:hypothetical protein
MRAVPSKANSIWLMAFGDKGKGSNWRGSSEET